jgi:plastocyanin
MPNNIKFGVPMLLAALLIFSLAFYGGVQLIEPTAEAPTPTSLPGTPRPTAEPGAPVMVHVIAKNILFNIKTITVPAGAQVTVMFDNQDPGVMHNVAFYTDRTARTKIYVGAIFAGPEVREYRFTAPATAGNYFFRCDVHPDTMTGTFVVE